MVALSSNPIQVAGTKGVFQSQGCADGGERTGDLLRNCQPCSDLLQLGPVVRLPGRLTAWGRGWGGWGCTSGDF